MRKIALIACTALPLFAGFFPATVNTSVSNIGGGNIKLSTALASNGMSGVIVHNYGNNLQAITGRFVQTSTDGQAKIISTDVIHHDELPTIKTAVTSEKMQLGDTFTIMFWYWLQMQIPMQRLPQQTIKNGSIQTSMPSFYLRKEKHHRPEQIFHSLLSVIR